MLNTQVDQVEAPRPTLSASVCALLQALTRGARAEDSLHITRGGGHLLGIASAMNVPVHEVSPVWIPAMLLHRFEQEDVSRRVSLPVMRGRGSIDPETLSAVACSFTLERVHRTGPSGSSLGLVWPLAQLDETLATLEAFSPPPTMVIDALPDLVAVWALDGPVPVRAPADQDRTMALLRSLAAQLGGDVPADDARLEEVTVPLPGTKPRNGAGEWEPVAVTALHPERVYSLSQIEAALAAKGK